MENCLGAQRQWGLQSCILLPTLLQDLTPPLCLCRHIVFCIYVGKFQFQLTWGLVQSCYIVSVTTWGTQH